MKTAIQFFALFFFAAVMLTACGDNTEKSGGNDAANTTENTGNKDNTDAKAKKAEDNIVPKIDIDALDTKEKIFDAQRKVTAAQVEDNKNDKADPNYDNHWVELTEIETALLKKATDFMGTIEDPQESIDFYDEFMEIRRAKYDEWEKDGEGDDDATDEEGAEESKEQ